MKVDILAVGVHPDDVELSCSGTLLKHIDKGYTVGLCDLTAGELGSRGTPELRIQEAESARISMGAEFRINLHMQDGFMKATKENTLRLIEVIRYCQPEIVLANAIEDRHPDHGRAAQFIKEACFYSGLIKIETSYRGQQQDAWRPKSVYHFIQDRNIKADFVVDISNFIDQKMNLIMEFKSQFFSENMDGPKTPISSKSFLEFIRAKNKAYGRDIGVIYAEAFTVNRDIGVEDLFHLR
ncbi:MAG: bacillithiol biosynthesis deacetylase BshB1 [Saprospiraceae bacterium]|nr:bacillithiol biosynthesis deacetylase BshB1 [Saprospiraceae bacterium]